MSRFNLLPNNNGAYAPNTSTKVHEYSEEIAQLKGEIERLDLITQAMWKLLQEKGLTDEDLVKAITEIDNAKKQRDEAKRKAQNASEQVDQLKKENEE